MAFHLVRQYLLLRLVAMFEKFLDDVVAKYVLHELHDIWQNLFKYRLFFVAIGRLKLLLDKSGTVLIAAKFDKVASDVL